jgi:hypothetical protein
LIVTIRKLGVGGILVVLAGCFVFTWAMLPATAAPAAKPGHAAQHGKGAGSGRVRAMTIGTLSFPVITVPRTTTPPTTATTSPSAPPVTSAVLPGRHHHPCRSRECRETTTTIAAPVIPTTRAPAPALPPDSGFTGISGVAGSLLGLAVAPSGAAPAKASTHRAAKPRPVAPAGIYNEPMVLAAGPWQGVSMQAATRLSIPILFGAAVALFILLQALVDRRDPKVSRAPERGDDDAVKFT